MREILQVAKNCLQVCHLFFGRTSGDLKVLSVKVFYSKSNAEIQKLVVLNTTA